MIPESPLDCDCRLYLHVQLGLKDSVSLLDLFLQKLGLFLNYPSFDSAFLKDFSCLLLFRYVLDEDVVVLPALIEPSPVLLYGHACLLLVLASSLNSVRADVACQFLLFVDDFGG